MLKELSSSPTKRGQCISRQFPGIGDLSLALNPILDNQSLMPWF